MSLPIYQPSRPLERVRSVIAVASGKGGVGKSTICAALAVALRQAGHSVGVLDADLYGPTMAHLFPEVEPAQIRDGQLLPAISHGVRLLSMAQFRPEWQSVALRAPMANGILSQFLKQAHWGDLDYLLIDLPPGTGDIQLTICQLVPITAALIVTTPQEVALLDVRRTCHLFHEVAVPIAGVVENMSYLEVGGERLTPLGAGGGERLAHEFGIPLLAQIPLDPDLCQRCERREIGGWCNEGSAPLFRELAVSVGKQLKERKVVAATLSDGKLSLTWPSGEVRCITPSELQRHCPCAGCREVKGDPEEGVELCAVEPVGHYAFRFRFSSGCSSGIFPYALLREVSLS